MGKTALLAYAVEQASDMTVLTVTGVEGESDLAFGGLHGLLSPVVDALGGVPEAQREALAAALGLAAGEGSDRLFGSSGGSRYWRPPQSQSRSCAWWTMRNGWTSRPRTHCPLPRDGSSPRTS